jgi:ASCH domain
VTGLRAAGELCLSVHQPFAGRLISGEQATELRSWRTLYRGRLWIFASRYRAGLATPLPPLGVILGSVRLTDCVPDAPGWCWLMTDPVPLAEPVPVKGRSGLWPAPAGLVAGTTP